MNKLVTVGLLVVVLAGTAAAQNITRQEAVQAINDAEADVVAMMEANLSTGRVNDSLQQARIALRRASYAAFLRNDSNGSYAQRAREELRGLDYRDFTYSDVLEHTSRIEQLRRRAFNLSDRLRATRQRLHDYRQRGLNVSEAADEIAAAQEALYRGQYDTAASALDRADRELDEALAERSIADVLAASGRSFVDQNRVEIVVFVTVIVVGGVLTGTYVRRRRRREKLARLKRKRAILHKLMAEAQEAYFVEEELSKTIYRARMETFQEQLTQIEEELAAFGDAADRPDQSSS